MIENYLQMLGACKTANEINKIHINLENTMTPMIFHSLLNGVRSDHAIKPPQFASIWLEKLDMLYRKVGKDKPENFELKKISDYLYLYESSLPISESNKDIIFCFTGNSERLMMPTPIFLQHFDANKASLLFIRKPRNHSYSDGLPGLSSSFDETLNLILGKIEDNKSFKSRLAVGTSAGGLPAIVAGLKFGCDKVLAFGAGDPFDSKWDPDSENQIASMIQHHKTGANMTNITLVYGADDLEDERNVETISKLVDSKKIKISSEVVPVKHLCLTHLLKEGESLNFINSQLYGID